MSLHAHESETRFFALIVVSLLASIAVLSVLPYIEEANGVTSPGGDWTSFTFDDNDSRYQSSSTITSANVASLQKAWFFPTDYSITGTPVVQNGYVYFADWGGNVYSLRVSTGEVNWQRNVGFPISSSLLLENGLVYVAGSPLGQTIVEALNENSGSVVWSRTLQTTFGEDDGAIYTSPIYYNNLIYVGISEAGPETNSSQLGEVFALTTAGAVSWNYTTMIGNAGGASVWGSFVIDPNLNAIFFGTGNSFVQASNNAYAYSILSLNAMTGQLNWNYTVYPNFGSGADEDFGSTPNLFSLTVNGQNFPAVGLGNKNGHYYILNRVTGELLYNLYLPNSEKSGNIIGLAGFYPSPTSPTLFIPSASSQSGGEVVAYNTSSISFPSPEWTFPAGARVVGSVAVVPGAVLFGDASGKLYAVNITNGEALYDKPLPNLPANTGIFGGVSIAEGYVFVGDYYYANPQSPDKYPDLGLYAFNASSSVYSSSSTSSSSTTTSSSSSSSSSSTTLTSPTSTSSSSHTTTAAAYGGGLKFSIPRLLSDPILIGIIVIVAIAAIAAGILIRRRR